MKFEYEIPDPSCLRRGTELYQSVSAGTVVHRIHPIKFAADQFNDSNLGNARFSPIRDQTGGIIPTIYAANTLNCAACETVLRSPDGAVMQTNGKRQRISPTKWRSYAYSTIKITSDINLLDISTKGQRHLGLDHSVLTAGPTSTYPSTRAWAEAIYAAFPDIDGIFYLSHQWSPDYACILFGDRASRKIESLGTTTPLTDSSVHRQLFELADRIHIDYLDL